MMRTLAALSVFAASLFAQRNVSPDNMYHRVYAVVPMVGAGTPADPRRPMLVPIPVPSQIKATARPDLLGFQMQPSDDGKFALVEFVFQNPVAYHNFLAKAVATPGIGVTIPALPVICADGSNLKALTANIAALKNAFESSVPGMRLFERGKVSQAAVLAQFRAHKANYAFGGSSVRPQ